MPPSPSTSILPPRPSPLHYPSSYSGFSSHHESLVPTPALSMSSSSVSLDYLGARPEFTSNERIPIPAGGLLQETRRLSSSSRSSYGQLSYQSFHMPEGQQIFSPGEQEIDSTQAYYSHALHGNKDSPLDSPFFLMQNQICVPMQAMSSASSTASRSPEGQFTGTFSSPAGYQQLDLPDQSEPTSSKITQPVEKTPRPPNAWIIYRSDKIRAYTRGETIPGLDELIAVRAEAQLEKDKEAGIDEEINPPLKSAKKIKGEEPKHKGLPQAEISRLIALMWKKETKAVKTKYDRLAEMKKAEHQQKYPNYKYQPMKKEDKQKIKEERERDRALARKEKALEKALRPRKPRARGKKASSPAEQEEGISTPPRVVTKRSSRLNKITPGKKAVQVTEPNYRHLSTMPMNPGGQIYWGAPPEMVNYHGPPPLDVPRPVGELSRNGSVSGFETSSSANIDHADFQDGQYQPSTTYERPPDPSMRPFPNYGHSIPPPEAGLAIEQSQVIPYIFEPMPFQGNYTFDGNATEGFQFIPQFVPNAPNSGNTYPDDAQGQPLDPLPPLQVPGVTESELQQMWALLEEDASGLDVPEDATSHPEYTYLNWAADANEMTEQWSDLNGPVEGLISNSQGISGPIADHIALNWAMQDQPRTSEIADVNGLPSLKALEDRYLPPATHGGSSSYLASSPGYITIEVPLEGYDGPHGYPSGVSTYTNHQGPALSAAAPLSPVNGTFNTEGWPMPPPDGTYSSFSALGPAGAGHMQSPGYLSRMAPGAPLENRLNHRVYSNQGLGYNSPDNVFDAYQDRRISEAPLFEIDPIEPDWESPRSEIQRNPSISDYRISSVSFPAPIPEPVPEESSEVQHQPAVEVVETKRFAPHKKSRVVGGNHPPPPPPTTSDRRLVS